MKDEMLTTDFLDRAVDLYDDVVGVVADDGTKYTYGEFGERVNRLSNALAELGVGPGDRVAMLASNTHYFLEALYATNQLGAVYVPMNYRLVAEEYAYILKDCEASVVIADHAFADNVERIRDSVPAEHFIGYDADRIDGEWRDYMDVVAAASSEPPTRPTLSEDEDATINYTSGTTGDPKGVVRTHRNEHWHALVLSHHHEIRDDDTYLWTLPMFHCNGWGHTYAITGVGGTHVCQRRFDPADTFKRVRTYDVSFLCGAPTVLRTLIHHYEENRGEVGTTGNREVRIATAGSAPATATIETVEEELGWRVLHLYGLTETTPLITTSNSPRRLHERGRKLKVKQGANVLGTDVRVVDANGNDVPRDGETIGEVVVRGNQVMDRYLNKPDATERAFNDRVEGYFHTGDLATIDEDGMIAIQDRKKDIIISGGENVSSIDVEDTLYDHPDVAKAAVIATPSEEWGEVVTAVLVPTSGRTPSDDEIEAFCRERMAGFKIPRRIIFRDNLPETATGKVQKYQLREEYWEGEEQRVGQQ